MSNVLDFNSKKKGVNDNIQNEILDFESEKLSFIKMYENDKFEVVARDEISAMIIAELILEIDSDISHVEYTPCISRIGSFIKITPVLKTDKGIIYAPDSLRVSYLNYLRDNDLIEINEDGSIIIKDNKPKRDM